MGSEMCIRDREVGERLPEDMLPLAPLQLPARGERRCELDDAVVEERGARLEGDGHRGDIRLDQQVARAVAVEIDVEEAGELLSLIHI